MKIKSVWFSVCAVLVMVLALAGGVAAAEKAAVPKATAGKIVLELPPVPGNPRNSEGAFAELGDGTSRDHLCEPADCVGALVSAV